MPKYNYSKRQIKSLIKLADHIKSILYSQNSNFTGWLLLDAVAQIHSNIINITSSVPQRFNAKCELRTYRSVDMYNNNMPFGDITIEKKANEVKLTISDNKIDINVTRSRHARYRIKTKNTRIHGAPTVSIES